MFLTLQRVVGTTLMIARELKNEWHAQGGLVRRRPSRVCSPGQRLQRTRRCDVATRGALMVAFGLALIIGIAYAADHDRHHESLTC